MVFELVDKVDDLVLLLHFLSLLLSTIDLRPFLLSLEKVLLVKQDVRLLSGLLHVLEARTHTAHSIVIVPVPHLVLDISNETIVVSICS